MLDLLDTAAVLGEEVDAGRVAMVTGRPVDEVRSGLDAAVRAGVLTAVPDVPGRRRFAHAVVRDAIYRDLSPAAGRNCTAAPPRRWRRWPPTTRRWPGSSPGTGCARPRNGRRCCGRWPGAAARPRRPPAPWPSTRPPASSRWP
ncbi:hypothetical protein [Blastococcus brunescens]|uniref:Uncharacterized protein n=1 Tax=Blastococcus brunescens TaxID=1564165 RepID=A0ABZ1AWD5_9ACTN|nr:hypothetical protein [Blastococcus sp. BMG 8361]WRL61983.1 hypothetical protein U6N30_18045 [Blastococcus sp. BMG 8361]